LGNYPNPFNPETEIVFNLKASADVELNIYNLKGQMIRTLINENMSAGEQQVNWNGIDSSNNAVGSGIYYYQLRSGKFTYTGKMVLLK